MSATTPERLYHLLPAIYRQRDAAQGEPLRALLAVIEDELRLVEDDIARLYDNWFIETCDEWVVPYLGDLLNVRGLLPVADGSGALSQRAIVANTLGYRRRKGSAAMLEQLARDVTGWPARAVEFFERLATTQHLNHPRLASRALADLRDTDGLELVDGPFERATHTAELRHIANRRGRYAIPNVGLFLWRLQPYAVGRGAPRPVADPADGRFTFNPLGIDAPLFNRARTERDIAQRAGEANVPGPLRRRPLHDELETLRRGEEPPGADRYFDDGPVLEVFRRGGDGRGAPVPAAKVRVCHLGAWRRPAAADEVLVDPALGRLTVAAGAPAPAAVSYAYGFGGDLGGGPYDRQGSVADWLDRDSGAGQRDDFQIGVTREPPPNDPQIVGTLAEAVAAWNALPSHRVERVRLPDGQQADRVRRIDRRGIIAVMDSDSHAIDLTGDRTIAVPAGSTLAIVAADWPPTPDPAAPGGRRRVAGRLLPAGLRPHLRGDLAVRAVAPAPQPGLPAGVPVDADQPAGSPGELILDGLLIEGALAVLAGGPGADGRPLSLGGLRLAHCTLVPGVSLDATGLPRAPDRLSLTVDPANVRLRARLERSITGPLLLPGGIAGLEARDSILDSPPRRSLPALVSGVLGTIALTAAAPAVDVTIGAEGPHRAALPAKPTTLGEARAGLEAAIRAAHGAPAFAGARVITVPETDRLIVLPGASGAVTFANARADPTATELRLTTGQGARQARALIGGSLTGFAGLTAAAPGLALQFGGDGPRLLDLAVPAPPETSARAREQLHAAIRAVAGDSAAFGAALVGRLDDRLVVISGVAGAAPAFFALPTDRTTLVELGLERDRPAISGGRGGARGFRPGPPTTLERTTVFGQTVVRELTLASETIFAALPLVERRQAGCVRFSYVPPGAVTPRRYRCEPDRMIAARLAEAEGRAAAERRPLTDAERTAIGAAVARAVAPIFTSARYGQPGYGQLAPDCPEPLRTGAEDEGEMGAFGFLQQAQRLKNLRANLDEYLRFGLEAGLFLVT